MRPPPISFALAERWSSDLTSFEYTEQIRAAREMQCLGVAAAPYAKVLAERLKDPRHQIRRACAEVLRMLAEASKDRALDAACEGAVDEKIATSETTPPTIAVVAPASEEIVKASPQNVPDSSALVSNEVVPPTLGSREGGESAQLINDRPPTTSGEAETIVTTSRIAEVTKPGICPTEGNSDKTATPSGIAETRTSSKQSGYPLVPVDGPSLAPAHSSIDIIQETIYPIKSEAETIVQASEVEARSDSKLPMEGLNVEPPPTATTVGSIDQQESLEGIVQGEVAPEITPRTQARTDPRGAVLPYLGHLVVATKDDRWQVRQSAALALAALGGDEVAEYVSEILEILSDEYAEVRCAAASVIEALGPLAVKHARTLMDHIHDASEEMRVQVVKAVAALGRKIEVKLRHVHVLVDLMKTDVASEVRLAAVNALRCQGRLAIPFYPECLEVVLEDCSRWVRHAALEILCDPSYESFTQIAALLKSNEVDVRRRAAKKLGEIAADFCASESGNRRMEIAERVAAKSAEQDKYFAARKEAKRKAKIKRMRETGLEVHSDSEVEDSDEEAPSEEPLIEEDLKEQAEQELDDAVISYIVALAGFLDDADEDLRTIAAEALRCMGAVKNPHTGKLLAVWQDGRWLTKPVAAL
eukprot:CAMPEP_0169075760 /NCGR_PEP_ID=MMETSP1015-20121227/7988_1 /TAXON_ID=342587 /ORGANISM="Karlodinium micrum, Strain CCMP2283" /LENGTH=644 /DNA_ID=CAMNT_0009135181 /DNA_START=44 /DNA_END=1975 /DNA_ORIENTATION=-